MQKFFRNLSLLPFRKSLKKASDYFSPNIHVPFLSPNNQALLKQIESLSPDIVHLHWCEGGFINVDNLKRIKKPILWSLHDENAYTGGCHCASSCIGILVGCKKCPILESNKNHDISYFTFKNKQKTYQNLPHLRINGLSRWIANSAKKSLLLQDKHIINLPNPIDTNLYKPIPKKLAREILAIENNKIFLAFGAMGGSSIKRKGFTQLKAALSQLENKEKYRLLVFGGESEEIEGIEQINLGVLHDEITLVLLYNACDIFIQPSLAENLSNAIMESLSCGVPVVAFDIGGNSDMVQHKHNGYLAQPLDIDDLKNGIEWLANLDSMSLQYIAQNARNSVLEKFDSYSVAARYIKAYEQLIKDTPKL